MMNDEFSLLFKMAVINTRIFIPINSLVKRVDATHLTYRTHTTQRTNSLCESGVVKQKPKH